MKKSSGFSSVAFGQGNSETESPCAVDPDGLTRRGGFDSSNCQGPLLIGEKCRMACGRGRRRSAGRCPDQTHRKLSLTGYADGPGLWTGGEAAS